MYHAIIMLKYASSRLVIATVSAFASLLLQVAPVSAQFGYSTGFEPSQGFTLQGGLSGYNGWISSDPLLQVAPGDLPNSGAPNYYARQATTFELIGQADSIGALDPNTGSGFYKAGLGGRGAVVPHSQTIYLSHPFDVSGFDKFSFNTDFKIFSSTNTAYNSASNTDTFGWTLFSGNVLKLGITFAPAGGGFFNVQIDGGASVGQLNYNAAHKLQLNIQANGDFKLNFNAVDFYSGTSTIDPKTITSVAATQIVQSATTDSRGAYINAGNNVLVFDNYAATPEPSTIGLALVAGFGGLAAMLRRRKVS